MPLEAVKSCWGLQRDQRGLSMILRMLNPIRRALRVGCKFGVSAILTRTSFPTYVRAMSARPMASSFEGSKGPNITIPLYTLEYLSDELFDMGGMVDRMQIQMVASLLSTIFVAVYTACTAYAAKILVRRGLRGNGRVLLGLTAAMYIATCIYWVTFLIGQFQTLRTLMRRLSDGSGWLSDLTDSRAQCSPRSHLGDLPEYCTTVQAPSYAVADEWAIAQVDCIGTAILTFNVVVGDAIVWWRVWVLWNKNRLMMGFGCMVLLATSARGIADSVFSYGPVIWNTYSGPVSSNITESGAFFGSNILGLVTIVLSLFSNTLATLLVGYKAWRHGLRAKKHFARIPTVTHAQRALMLLVESGITYCVLWALLLSSNVSWFVTPLHSVLRTSAAQTWTTYMLYFSEGCLVSFVGIYPTLIIILVALDKSEIEKQSLAYSISVTRALPSSPVQVEVTTDVFCAADTSVHGERRPHSVTLIGLPSPLDRSSATLGDVTSEGDTEFSKIPKSPVHQPSS